MGRFALSLKKGCYLTTLQLTIVVEVWVFETTVLHNLQMKELNLENWLDSNKRPLVCCFRPLTRYQLRHSSH
jgi:hypothetical protein